MEADNTEEVDGGRWARWKPPKKVERLECEMEAVSRLPGGDVASSDTEEVAGRSYRPQRRWPAEARVEAKDAVGVARQGGGDHRCAARWRQAEVTLCSGGATGGGEMKGATVGRRGCG
jgi:hypothetical protein